MKNNNIYIITVFFIGAIMFNSCNKNLLDVAPPANLSTTIFWRSPSDADLALTALYSSLATGSGLPNIGLYEVPFWDDFSDNASAVNNELAGLTALTSGITPVTGGAIGSLYVNNYQAISIINSFLANVGKVLTGQKLDEYRAEAHFLRAFNYWWLARTYGNVPVTTADPFTISPSKHLPASPRDSVLDLVESDLDSSILYLPDESYSASGGHVVKSAAQGYLVSVLLFRQKYQQAATVAQQIMTANKFSLNPCYSCNFYKPDQNGSREIMFSVKFQAPQLPHPNNYSMALVMLGFKGPQGTQDMINAYEMANGKSITDPTSGYDPNDPWSNRDPRMRMTYFFPGDTQAQGWFITSNPVGTPGMNQWNKGFYMTKKWLAPGITNPGYGTIDDIDWVLLRYADILLMYAEAQNEAVGPDPSVYNAVNLVRERVGMPDLPPGYDQTHMRDAIRLERRVEFAMEGIRYFDLRRWGIAEQVLNGFVQNPLYPNIKTIYKSNYEYWPIPQYEIDYNSPEMKQNAGY